MTPAVKEVGTKGPSAFLALKLKRKGRKTSVTSSASDGQHLSSPDLFARGHNGEQKRIGETSEGSITSPNPALD